MSTIFRGVFAESLGGFLVIRGFARHSIADTYQRDVKPDHQADIKQFYERGEYLFFPEVVLSLELLSDYEKPDAPTDEPWRLLTQGQTFKSNVNGVRLKPIKTRSAADLTRVNITIPDKAGAVLKRIDGNHRISAFEGIGDKEALDRKPVSFCIVVLPQDQAQ